MQLRYLLPFAFVLLTLVEEMLGLVDYDIEYSESNGLFHVSLSTFTLGEPDRYVAIAFAPSEKMEHAEGYYCDGKNLRSIVIQLRQEPPIELEDAVDTSVTSVTQSTSDGFLSCSFIRSPSVTREIMDGVDHEFDFQTKSYFVLTATGGIRNGKLDYHNFRQASSQAMNFSSLMREIDQPPEIDETTELPLLPDPISEPDIPLPSEADAGMFDLDSCGMTKTCVEFPAGCSLESEECMFFSWEQREDYFNLELSGGSGDGQQYIAVAFSKDESMSDADLFYCTGAELKSAVIREQHQAPVDLSIAGVRESWAVTINGVGQCAFKRDACLSKVVSNNERFKFDLVKDEHYVLMARGNMLDGKLVQHDGSRIHSRASLALGIPNDSNYTCIDVPDNNKGGANQRMPCSVILISLYLVSAIFVGF